MDSVNNLKVQVRNIEEEMRTAFLDYSMSVIVSRALPDVRDGMKPVHRRILFAMYGLKNFFNKPYLKSARIVGDVIGKYHPHGDAPVYEALVRMAQDFAMRYLLVDGQGNFGSIDGDSAAAMRYTEVRLKELAGYLLADIDQETVDFGPNYDNKEEEPLVLPAKFPQLLVNGASGIAVGMATSIPPHNMKEVVSALEALIDNPKIDIAHIMQYIPGPDFPTGATILGAAGIAQAYGTGRGSIVMRARTSIEDIAKSGGRQRIVIREIPYQVNKARLIERIAELVRDKKLEGISDIRDESAQDDIRVAIDLKRDEQAEIVLNNLYKQTPLQSTFSMNMVALVNGIPRVLNLKQVLEYYLLHRREVILRRTAHQLRKAEEKAHILLGLKTAVENIDDVVALIRKSENSEQAQKELIAKYALSEIQAKAILEMRLSRLTGLEREKIIAEYEEVLKIIADLKDILEKSDRVTKIIREELVELKEKFSDERRTEITMDAGDITMEALVADEEVVVTVSHTGYVKRTPATQIAAQKRGGKGRTGMKTKDEDFVKDLFVTTNHQTLLCFTSLGRVYDLKVYQIPEADLTGRGKHFANLVKLQAGESVISTLAIKEFKEGQFILSATSKGYVKKTDLMSFSNLRSSGVIALTLEEGDTVVGCVITGGKDEILICTKMGKSIRFNEEECRPMGRTARGVTGIRFSEDEDIVIGVESLRSSASVMTICENGYGKRTSLEEYRTQSRGGKGVYSINVSERNGPVVNILQVEENDDLVIMTSAGKMVRFNVNELGVIGRFTQGVRLINVESGEKVIGAARIMKFGNEEVS